MADFDVVFYDADPNGIFGTAVGAFSSYSGPSSADGSATITDNEAGVEGQTLDDDSSGGETATATVTLNGNTSTGTPVDAEMVWTIRDTVTNQVFQIVQFHVETGDAAGMYLMSEIPLVAGRSYETLAYDADPNVNDGDPAFTYADQTGFPDGTVDGTAGDDTMIAFAYTDAQNDALDNSGNTVRAGDGSDDVRAGSGNDEIYGDAGDDFIEGGSGNDTIYGGTGNDTLMGDGGDDSVFGGAGDDMLDGYSGDDYIDGGTGADLVMIYYNEGTDTLFGGADTDTLDFDDNASGFGINLTSSGTGAGSYIFDMAGSDGTFAQFERFVGTDADDTFNFALDGSGISVFADAGEDSITGGSGDDTLNAGAGNDTITGGAGDDVINAGSGDDSVTSLSGNDTVDAGAGDDTILYSLATDSIQAGSGDDTVIATGTTNSANPTTIDGGIGTDTFVVSSTSTYFVDHVVNLEAGKLTYNGADRDFLSNFENVQIDNKATGVIGSAGDNVITATGAFDNSLSGRGGDDRISAGDGNDVIDGGAGNDTIDGGAGNDIIGGGSAVTVTPTSEFLNWSLAGADEQDISAGFIQDTGVMDVSVSYQNNGLGTEFSVETSDSQYVGSGEPFAEFSAAHIAGFGNGAYSTTTLDFAANTEGYASAVENVSFRINDIDSNPHIDTVTINAYDADGNAVPISLTQSAAGNDNISGNTVSGSGGLENSNDESASALVQITGPVSRIEIVYSNDGTSPAVIDVTDVHFSTLQSSDDDVLTGGGGDDTFILTDGNDIITDFNTGNTGALNDDNPDNNDFIDLSAYYDNLKELWADQGDDGVLNQSNSTDSEGNAVDYSDNTQFGARSVTLQGASADENSLTRENTGVVCFTSGTAIRTPRGEVLIDDLRIGDLVTTLDNGPQPIRWIGRRNIGHAELASNAKLRPVLVPRGVIGAARDLFVSRQHALLINQDELARAIHLTGIAGVPARVAHGKRQVSYVHLMFDAHEIIFAEGVPAESFYPGQMAVEMLTPDAREEMVCLFPEFALAPDTRSLSQIYGAPVRSFVKPRSLSRPYRPLVSITSNQLERV